MEHKLDEKETKEIRGARVDNGMIAYELGRLKIEVINLESRLDELDKMEEDMTARYKGNVKKEKKINSTGSQRAFQTKNHEKQNMLHIVKYNKKYCLLQYVLKNLSTTCW
jgi:hypothetical protein